MAKYDYDEVKEWLEENKGMVIARVNEVLDSGSDSERSSYEYSRVSQDEDQLEIWGIDDDEDHLCSVMAKGEIEIGHLVSDQEGALWPDDYSENVNLFFFVDRDSSGAYSVSFDTDQNGDVNVDFLVRFSEPDEII